MIIREDRGSVAVVRLAHGKVSALDAPLVERLIDELDAVRKDESRAAVVLTGTGSAFSAGIDLFQMLDGGAGYVKTFLPRLDTLLAALVGFPKPAVAAINGHAVGAGAIIAAACDHRVMAEGTGRIGLPELTVGVPFPALALEIMASRVAATALRGLVFTGRTVLVDEAVEVGLADEGCDPAYLAERAWEIAEQLASIPPRTFALAKRAFAAPLLDRVKAMAALDAAVLAAWTEPETLTAVRAYLGRTMPKEI